jgi:3'-phosphoadenosine 5'-phosphosulfate sulfotransferase (PAPS reductase)/FAD synthetase
MELDRSKEIIEQAIAQYNPYAVCLLMSGGKDSMAAYQITKSLDVKIDFIVHVNTRTGIQETTQFTRDFAASEGIRYIEGNAGSSYEDYVIRKGFFGKGSHAHSFAYHVLKRAVLGRAISQNIRKGKRGREILLINGARSEESDRRMIGCGSTSIRKDKTGVWVSIINDWTKCERDDFLNYCKAPINPVTTQLCRSGECLCGTMQNQATRLEASYFYPEWGNWIDNLEARVKANGFPWGWGENMPKSYALEKAGQLNLFNPMCTSCKLEELG